MLPAGQQGHVTDAHQTDQQIPEVRTAGLASGDHNGNCTACPLL